MRGGSCAVVGEDAGQVLRVEEALSRDGPGAGAEVEVDVGLIPPAQRRADAQLVVRRSIEGGGPTALLVAREGVLGSARLAAGSAGRGSRAQDAPHLEEWDERLPFRVAAPETAKRKPM